MIANINKISIYNYILDNINLLRKINNNEERYIVFRKLENLVDISDELATKLLKKLKKIKDIDILSKEYLRCIAQMEKEVAIKILTDEIDLKRYKKYNEYMRRANFELLLSRYQGVNKIHRCLFVGSGALPLTSIILKQRYQISSTLLDIDEEAVDISNRIIEKFNLNGELKVINKDIFNYVDFDNYNLIIVASSVGGNADEKNALIDHFNNNIKRNTLIILRAPYCMEKLLQPDYNMNLVDEKFKVSELLLKSPEDTIHRYVIY